MTFRSAAIALIVLGVGATLVGLYGQVFLNADDGHHDGRTPTFALDSSLGADSLVVTTGAPGTIEAEVVRAGRPIGRNSVHDAHEHVFVVDAGFDFFEHVAVTEEGGPVSVAAPSGEVRVVVQASPSGGPDLLELGATVDVVDGGQVPEQNVTDSEVRTDGDLTVTRQGFDFVLSEPWNGDDVFGGPALLTLFRAGDFAFSHAHARTVGDDRFAFDVDLAGTGDHLAALEFEQGGQPVTALFRFTI